MLANTSLYWRTALVGFGFVNRLLTSVVCFSYCFLSNITFPEVVLWRALIHQTSDPVWPGCFSCQLFAETRAGSHSGRNHVNTDVKCLKVFSGAPEERSMSVNLLHRADRGSTAPQWWTHCSACSYFLRNIYPQWSFKLSLFSCQCQCMSIKTWSHVSFSRNNKHLHIEHLLPLCAFPVVLLYEALS